MIGASAADELIRIRTDALFRHDDRGRTTAINQWNGGEPPRFYLARAALEIPADSGPGDRRPHVCRVRADVAEDVARALRRLAADEPPLCWVPQSAGGRPADRARIPADPPAHEADYARLLGRGSDDVDASGPIYWFAVDWSGSDIIPDRRTVLIDATNAHLLRGDLEAWLPDVPHRQPMVAVVEDGRAVSVCASVRISGNSHEAGVETAPDRRRRGHAVAAVAAWARETRRRGVPQIFYSTAWRNAASRAVADRLRLTPIGTDFSVE